jgi:hypothetical protein
MYSRAWRGHPLPLGSQIPRTVWQIAVAKLQSASKGHHEVSAYEKNQRMKTQLFDHIIFSGLRCLPEQVQESG